MGINNKFLLTKEAINESLTKASQPAGEWSFKKSIANKTNVLKIIRWQAKWKNTTPKSLKQCLYCVLKKPTWKHIALCEKMSGKAKTNREKLNECLQQMQINMSIDDISNDINLQFV